MKKQSVSHVNRSGEGLVVVVILVLILGAGAWWLFSTKNTSEKEARAFGRQMIENLAVKHDLAFFVNNLGPQAKSDYPPSMQQMVIQKLTEMGTPAQPIKIDENIAFESQFFSPRGFFTAHLNYPGGPTVMELAISHPVGKWQVDNLTITWKAAPTQ
jgi:hypothetical protein